MTNMKHVKDTVHIDCSPRPWYGKFLSQSLFSLPQFFQFMLLLEVVFKVLSIVECQSSFCATDGLHWNIMFLLQWLFGTGFPNSSRQGSWWEFRR